MGSCCQRSTKNIANPEPLVTLLEKNKISLPILSINSLPPRIPNNIYIIPASPSPINIDDENPSPSSSSNSIPSPSSSKLEFCGESDRKKRHSLMDFEKTFNSSSTLKPETVVSETLELNPFKKSVKTRGSEDITNNNLASSEYNYLSFDSAIFSSISKIYELKESESLTKNYSSLKKLHSQSSFTYTNDIIKQQSIKGKKINQYTILEQIGKGSFGVVYKICDDNENVAAAKVCNKRHLQRRWVGKRKTALDLVRSEIEIMKNLEHKHILKLIEVIDSAKSNKIYLILEYAEHGSIHDKCPMNENGSKKYFRSLIKAVS